jgi:hypothetical protein
MDSGILDMFPRGEREWIALRAESEVGLQSGRLSGLCALLAPLFSNCPTIDCLGRSGVARVRERTRTIGA